MTRSGQSAIPMKWSRQCAAHAVMLQKNTMKSGHAKTGGLQERALTAERRCHTAATGSLVVHAMCLTLAILAKSCFNGGFLSGDFANRPLSPKRLSRGSAIFSATQELTRRLVHHALPQELCQTPTRCWPSKKPTTKLKNVKTTMPWWKRIFYRRLPNQAVIQPRDVCADDDGYRVIRYANEDPSGWKVLCAEVYRPRWVKQWREWNVKKS